LDPQSENESKCVIWCATFWLYIHRSWTLGKPYGIECGAIGNNLRNPMWTWWKHIENKAKKNKKLLPDSPHATKKKTGPLRSAYWTFSLAAWNFYFHTFKKERGWRRETFLKTYCPSERKVRRGKIK
jgi:hypothetical protein